MKKTTTIFCVFIFYFFVSLAYAETQSSPAFWKVSRGEATVYLLGSMHFGRSDFYPLPKLIENAFSRSDRLAVEVDISKISPAVAMQAIFKHGGLSVGQTLKGSLKPALYQALSEQCELNNLPVTAFDSFQPWFVAMQLVEAEIKKTNLKQSLGTELYFLAKGGKKVDQLETLDSQLGIFSQFSLADQAPFLEQTLTDLADSQKYLATMADGWRNGDTAALEKQIIAPFKENAATKKLFDSLFTLRNIKMAESVDQYLKKSQNVFFMVGAGHMIGKGGIVDLLEIKGYKVDRLSFR